MALFKRRTTKTVGKEIGRSIERTKQKEKILRTLQKEKEVRDRERKISEQIKQIKRERPTLIKSIVRGTRNTAKTISNIKKPVRRTATKTIVRRRTARKKPVRRTATKTIVRRRTARKKPVRRTARRVTEPRRQVRESVPIGFEGFY